jgi:glutamate 5-kinase
LRAVLVNYSAQEGCADHAQGVERVEAILGYVDEPELIHREQYMVLLG